MNNLMPVKSNFFNYCLSKHFILLGLFNCFFLGLYFIDEQIFFFMFKIAVFSLSLYLFIHASLNRYIAQKAFLSYISIFYGAINLALSLRLIFIDLFDISLNSYETSLALDHLVHISFALFLIILTITYVKNPKRLEGVSCILMGCFGLVVVFLFPILLTNRYVAFITSPTLSAFLFHLASNLFFPFAILFILYKLYPIQNKIPNIHKIILLMFAVCCMTYEAIHCVNFSPLPLINIISYFFRLSSLYLLVIGSIDCYSLPPIKPIQSKKESLAAEYEHILTFFPDALILCQDHQIVYTNEVALELFHSDHPKTLRGHILFDYLDLDEKTLSDYHHLKSHCHKFLKGESKMTSLNGITYDVEYIITPTSLHNSVNIVCILRNITEKKQKLALEKALEEQTLKMNYFSNLSHDIKMPINIIYSALQMQKHANTLSECLHYTSMMQSNALKLIKLINNILDLVKIDNNMFRFSCQVFNLVDAVETLCEASYCYMQEKNISYTFDTDLDERLIYTDPSSFERVIFNLLSNAIKYTPNGGQLYITILNESEGVQIDIQDTGIGIASDQIEHIFDRFITSDQGTCSKEHSCGIGLSIVRDLVHIMGGSISCSSKVNEGSCFSIHLPTPPIEDVVINLPYQSTYTSHSMKIEFCDI